MAHLLKDGLTCIPVEAWLNQELRLHLPALVSLANQLDKHRQNWDQFRLTLSYRRALCWLAGWRVDGTDCYCIPFLSPEYCDKLLVEAGAMAEYKVNDEEEQPYQIPELVLAEHCTQLFTCLQVLFDRVFTPCCKILYGHSSSVLRSVQFAKYTPENTAKGNWHVDMDSDITAVVSLDPEAFEGGGTAVRTGAMGTAVIPKLPKGHALLFHGKTTLHKGLAVESGVRDLLVFWSELK